MGLGEEGVDDDTITCLGASPVMTSYVIVTLKRSLKICHPVRELHMLHRCPSSCFLTRFLIQSLILLTWFLFLLVVLYLML